MYEKANTKQENSDLNERQQPSTNTDETKVLHGTMYNE